MMINVITRQTAAYRLKLLNSSHTIYYKQIKFINKLVVFFVYKTSSYKTKGENHNK